MKKNRILLPLLALGLPMMAMAGPRSFQQAKTIAEKQAAKLGIVIDEKAMAKARTFGPSSDSSTPSTSAPSGTQTFEVSPYYYVFPNGENKGFTIVSGDDRMPEIVGYSSLGTYDESQLPANYVSFMNAYQQMCRDLAVNNPAAKRNLAEVQASRKAYTPTKAVAPLLGEIAWDQGDPYNLLCPLYDKKHTAATGCVATAMAQVMGYYRYPSQLKADIPSYTSTWNNQPTTVPGIKKEEGVYDWNNILPKYNGSISYTDAQANAIAKLMFHCGAAVCMDYGPESSAFVFANHLSKYFGYDADLMLEVRRAAFSLKEWQQLIDTELAAGRPILYDGDSSDGSHQFVCDGSDGYGLYHINWGWSGAQDGYFDLTILNPEKGGTGSGNAADGFVSNCEMIIGIQPDNGKIDQPLAQVPAVTLYYDDKNLVTLTKNKRNRANEEFELKAYTTMSNLTKKAFSGKVALGIQKTDGSYEPVSNQLTVYLKPIADDGEFDIHSCNFTVRRAFPVGNSTIYAIYSHDGKKWEKCEHHTMLPFLFEATATELKQISALEAKMTAQNQVETNATTTFNLTLTNHADFEYLNYVTVRASVNQNENNATEVTKMFVTVPARSTITYNFDYIPVEQGNLYFWVKDESCNRTICQAQSFFVEKGYESPITLVEASCNASSDLFETEKALYAGYQVRCPLVEDDHVTYTFGIKNTGEPTTVIYCFLAANAENLMAYDNYEYLTLKGNGEVTTITKSFTPEEVGSHSILSYLQVLDSNDNKIEFPTLLPNNHLYTLDGYDIVLPASQMMVYVTGVPSGISPIVKDEAKSGTVNVYNLTGQKVKTIQAGSADSKNLHLPAGVYIMNGKKILVK